MLQAPCGVQIQHLPKAAAKLLLTALRGSALGTTASANTDRLLTFEGIYSLKGLTLAVRCLFPPSPCKRDANQEKPK